MSDEPTHFRNEIVRLVAKGLKTPYHFTLPYTPWSNGAVERLGKAVLRVFRSVCSGLRRPTEEWPDLLPLVQSALNMAPSPQRGNVAPITAKTVQDPSPPIRTFFRMVTATPATLIRLQSEQAPNLQVLMKPMDELHPAINRTVSDNRESACEARKAGRLPNIEIGDYVLVTREDFHAGEKLSLRWQRPQWIFKALKNFVYQVKDLQNGGLTYFHVSRLRFYSDRSLNAAAVMTYAINSKPGMPVLRHMRLVADEGGLKVQARWRDLPYLEDTTKPLLTIYENVPRMLLCLLKSKSTPCDLAKQALDALGP